MYGISNYMKTININQMYVIIVYMDGMGLFGVNLHHLEAQMLINSPFFGEKSFEKSFQKVQKKETFAPQGIPDI